MDIVASWFFYAHWSLLCFFSSYISIHWICYTWRQATRTPVEPVPPDFVNILHCLSLSIYTNHSLPSHLYQLMATLSTNLCLPPLQSLAAPSPSVYLTSRPVDDASVDQFTVSNATGLRTAASHAGTFELNPNGDITLQCLLPFTLKIRDLMGNQPPPTSDDMGSSPPTPKWWTSILMIS